MGHQTWDEPTIGVLLRALAACMSDVSETCYCAEWLVGLEERLPALCAEAVSTGRPVEFGLDHIAVAEARLMLALAEACGRWATFDDLGDG